MENKKPDSKERLYTEAEVLEVLRQCLFYGTPEYYEQGGLHKNINYPPNGTYKKAKDYFERFYLNKKYVINSVCNIMGFINFIFVLFIFNHNVKKDTKGIGRY